MRNKLLLSVAVCGLMGVVDANAQSYTSLNQAVSSTTVNKDYIMSADESVLTALGVLKGASLNIVGTNAGGTNYSIVANGVGGVLLSSTQTLTIKDVFDVSGFINGNAAVIDNSGKVTIENSNFSNNKATAYGGVIRNNTTANLKIFDSDFSNNSAGTGSAVLSNLGVVEIENSSFMNNTANAIGNVGSLTISGGVFEGNSFSEDGGAIQSKSDIVVAEKKMIVQTYGTINSTFKKNSARNGGAIWNSVLQSGSSISAVFSENSATSFGGAIYNTGNLDYLYASLVSNYAAKGGAVYNTGSINAISNIGFTGKVEKNFANSTSQAHGGAIYNSGSIINIDNDIVFANNYAQTSVDSKGGAIYNALDAEITLIDAQFNSNYALGKYSKGGAIYNEGIIETIDSVFSLNGSDGSTTVTSYGGAIYNAGIINNISGEFNGNRASIGTEGSKGGAIYNEAGAVIKAISASFSGNYVSGFPNGDVAGAIYNEGVIEQLSGNFSNNGSLSLTDNGGAIYNTGTINIIGGVYKENTIEPDGKGGAIYNSGTMNIANASFTDNSTGTDGLGGAIYNEGNMVISASTRNVVFSGNKVGGASDNGIHNTSNLDINAFGGYTVTMNDHITGVSGAIINVNTSSSGAIGNVILNANIVDNVINFYNGTLSLGTYTQSGVDVGIEIGTLYANTTPTGSMKRELNMIDGKISDYIINGEMYLENTDLAIDINLDTETADNFTILNEDGSAAINTGIEANTGVVLVNVTDFDMGDTQGDIVIFKNQKENANITLLEEDITIVDFEKKITLSQKTDDKGAYEYNLDATGYNLNGAIGLDAAHTQYDMKLKTPTCTSCHGNEEITSQNVGYYNSLTSKYESKDMVVNGLAGGENGFIVSSEVSGIDAELTLISESTYSSVNVNYDDVNFKMSGAGNNVITFNMKELFDETTLDSDFASDNINNELILNGVGVYNITGYIENLTLNANSNVNLDGTITGAKVEANGVLSVSGAIADSTIDVKTMFEASSTITNSTITTSGLVTRDGYDNGVAYNLNEGGTLSYTNFDYLYDGSQVELNSINFSGGELLGFQNDVVTEIKLDNLSVLKQSSLSLDVDLASKTMDSFIANSYTATAGFDIEKLVLISDAHEDVTVISFTDNANLAANTVYTGLSAAAFSPLYQYKISYDNTTGDFMFNRGQDIEAFNPAVFTSTIAKNVHTYATFDVFEEVLMNADSLDVHKNKLNASSGDDIKQSKAWFKTFGSNEDVDFNNFVVDNKTYGGILGIDSDVENINGWSGIYSLYVAYVGSTQEYEDVNINQNGALFGTRALFEKNNWFNGTTASVGTSFVDGTNLLGDEDFWMFSAGLSNKTGYKYEISNKYMLQPSLTLSYLYTYTTNYKTAGSLKVDANSLNALQIKPEVKFVANLENGYRPYAALSYNWNVLSNPEVNVSNVDLPELSSDPYAEYKLGATKSFADDIMGYAEISVTTGSREGFGAQLGVKWSF